MTVSRLMKGGCCLNLAKDGPVEDGRSMANAAAVAALLSIADLRTRDPAQQVNSRCAGAHGYGWRTD
jgi:hypothetical protein